MASRVYPGTGTLRDIHTWSVKTEALFGLAAGMYDGTFTAFRRSVHPGDGEAFEMEVEALLVEHRDSIATFRAVWPDGTLHWLEERAAGCTQTTAR